MRVVSHELLRRLHEQHERSKRSEDVIYESATTLLYLAVVCFAAALLALAVSW